MMKAVAKAIDSAEQVAGQASVQPHYLQALTLVERLHRRPLDVVAELGPTRSKDLDPVVLPRVVRCGDHRRRATTSDRQPRKRRRGHDSTGDHGGALRAQAGGQRSLEHRARGACVPRDQPCAMTQDLGCSGPQRRDGRWGQLGESNAANTIGAEAQQLSAWCTEAPCGPS